MSFLAQIDLLDFSGTFVADAMPSEGLLSFFYSSAQSAWGFDPKDKEASRVYWMKGPTAGFSRAAPPKELSYDGIFKQCAAHWMESVSLPNVQSPLFDALKMTEPERQKYCSLLDPMLAETQNRHQLLGYSDPLQGDMALECQLASNGVYCGDADGFKSSRAEELRSGASDWRLLFQLGSDERSAMMWGDSGKLYFWIKQQDLSEGRFENTWMILQCA